MHKRKEDDYPFYATERYSNDIVRRITAAVRRADNDFKRSGGSSRHWVLECFIPALADFGIDVVLAAKEKHGT